MEAANYSTLRIRHQLLRLYVDRWKSCKSRAGILCQNSGVRSPAVRPLAERLFTPTSYPPPLVTPFVAFRHRGVNNLSASPFDHAQFAVTVPPASPPSRLLRQLKASPGLPIPRPSPRRTVAVRSHEAPPVPLTGPRRQRRASGPPRRRPPVWPAKLGLHAAHWEPLVATQADRVPYRRRALR